MMMEEVFGLSQLIQNIARFVNFPCLETLVIRSAYKAHLPAALLKAKYAS